MDFANFNFDFGTRPTTTKLEKVVVCLDTNEMVGDYAKALLTELERRNPIRAKEVNITLDECENYLSGILSIRVASVKHSCPMWREAKQLVMPAFYEFVISQVGRVVDVDRGLEIVPEFTTDVDMNSMLETSDKLRAFSSDGIVLVKDAFPREETGDVETMCMAIINDYVMSMSKDAHPIASYVAAFLGMKLREEEALNLLYRVRYDDVSFIRSMLLREESIYAGNHS